MLEVLYGLGTAALCALMALLSISWYALYAAFSSVREFPGPRPVWPLGTAHLFKKDENGMRIDQTYQELQKQYGSIVRFFFSARATLVVSDMETIKDVLVSKFKFFHDRGDFPTFTNPTRRMSERTSIGAVKGPLWSSIRGAAQPVFHTHSLQRYSEDMNEAGVWLLEAIEKHPSGEAFDMDDLLHEAALRVIFKCAFGTSLPKKDDSAGRQLLDAASTMLQYNALADPWSFLVFALPPSFIHVIESVACSLGAMRMERPRDVIYAVQQQLAENYCRAHPEVEPFPADKGLLGRGLGLKLLPDDCVPSEDSILVACMKGRNKETGAPLKPHEVLAQAFIFMIAGFETTANALAIAVSEIARRPDVEGKLLREMEGNGWDTVPTSDTLDKWPYAKGIIYETLRHHPLAPMLVREANEDCVVGGRLVRKGTAVHINVKAVHEDPSIWPEPEAFQPERFESNPAAFRSANFLAFGFGPRNCIGYRFAIQEAAILLVRMYQQFTFKLCETHHPGGEVTLVQSDVLRVKGGLWLRATPRVTASKPAAAA